MAPNCWLHNQQVVLGWNCHGRSAVSTCTLKTSTVALHIEHCRSTDCIFLLFLVGAISAVVGACCAASLGNCPLPFHRDKVYCCEVTGDICGLMSATISHTSSEEAEDGGAGTCNLWCLLAVTTACQIRQEGP